jgi:hypothetical protein
VKQEHLDAEVVAGWAEGTLDPQARASAEAHAADCVRCQAVLAAMVRTEPVAASPARGWLGARVRWLVPLATAAAAAVLWVALSTDAIAPEPAPMAARPGRTASDASGQRAAATPESMRAAGDAAIRETAPDESRQRGVDVPAAPPSLARNEAPQRAEKSAVAADTAALDELRSSAPEPKVARVEEQRRDPLAGRGAPSAPPPPAAQTPPRPAVTETVAVQSQSQQVQAQSPTGLARQATYSSATGTLRDVATPDPAVRYQVGSNGWIQRSTDAGRSWTVQRSGVSVELVAGDAPSSGVCWVVGGSGVVLLTIDGGTTWRRISFPEATDLRSVEATDSRVATITAGDGRTFRTTDGGVSWQR